jgi:hypothetical protein
MNRIPRAVLLPPGPLLALVLLGCSCSVGRTFESRGAQFIGFHHFSAFEQTRGVLPGEVVLTSPIIEADIQWDQLVASWNTDSPAGTYLKVEARALYPLHTTGFYVMGLWSTDPARFPRESVPRQKDDDGEVSTDTLMLTQPATRMQLRLTLGGEDMLKPKLRFLGVSLLDSKASPPVLPPNRAAWGKLIEVPERSQMVYPNGKVLCSPTTVSMLMSHWSQALGRPELDEDVPKVAQAVYDTKWKGTGNWAFNVAYAGSFPGMRAYVTRMTDVSELEDWVANGLPVGISVCYDRLRGKGPGPNGHLVVCVGFTETGDPIINDPGTSKNVRKVFPRKNLIYAWSYSHDTAYLICPADSEIPTDRFGHWASWTAHRRIRFE